MIVPTCLTRISGMLHDFSNEESWLGEAFNVATLGRLGFSSLNPDSRRTRGTVLHIQEKSKTPDVPPSISKNFEDLQFMVSGLSKDLDLLRLEINNRLLTMEQTLQIIRQQQAESSQSLSALLDILRNIFSLP